MRGPGAPQVCSWSYSKGNTSLRKPIFNDFYHFNPGAFLLYDFLKVIYEPENGVLGHPITEKNSFPMTYQRL